MRPDEDDDFDFADMPEFNIEELLADAEPQAEEINSLNAAPENNVSQFTSTEREYTRLRPDPALDYSILEEYGIGGYDVFFIGSPAVDMRVIVETFLTHVRDDFYTHGIGTYDCIWRLRPGHGNFNEERVKRTCAAWRAAVRRIRDQLQPSDTSVFTTLRTQLLTDTRYAVVSLGRMTPQIYDAVDAKRRAQGTAKVGYLERVKHLI